MNLLPNDIIKYIGTKLHLYEQESCRITCKSFVNVTKDIKTHTWILKEYDPTSHFNWYYWQKKFEMLVLLKPKVVTIHLHVLHPHTWYFFSIPCSIEFSTMLRSLNTWLLEDTYRTCFIYGIYFRTVWLDHILAECADSLKQIHFSGMYESYTLDNLSLLGKINIEELSIQVGHVDILNLVKVKKLKVTTNMESLIDLSNVPKSTDIAVYVKNSFSDVRLTNPSNIIHLSISCTLNMGTYFRFIHHILERTEFPNIKSIGIGDFSLYYDFEPLLEYVHHFLDKYETCELHIENVEDVKCVYLLTNLKKYRSRVFVQCQSNVHIVLAILLSRILRHEVGIKTLEPLYSFYYKTKGSSVDSLYAMLPDYIKPSWSIAAITGYI